MKDVTKGPGDLWHPDEGPEEAFGRDVAADNVAKRWQEDGDAAVALEAIADAGSAIAWVSANLEIPECFAKEWRELISLSLRAVRAIDEEYETLNAPSEPEE